MGPGPGEGGYELDKTTLLPLWRLIIAKAELNG